MKIYTVTREVPQEIEMTRCQIESVAEGLFMPKWCFPFEFIYSALEQL
jgi:hypothetical protein